MVDSEQTRERLDEWYRRHVVDTGLHADVMGAPSGDMPHGVAWAHDGDARFRRDFPDSGPSKEGARNGRGAPQASASASAPPLSQQHASDVTTGEPSRPVAVA